MKSGRWAALTVLGFFFPRGLAAEERKAEAGGKKKPKTVIAADLPDFIAPQLCETLDRPPSAGGLGARDQVRRLSHPAACRGRRGDAAHPQGARLDGEIRRHRQGRRQAARLHPRWRDRARWTTTARPDFAALQAACRTERPTPDLLRLRLLFADGEDLRPCRCPSARRGWKNCCVDKPATTPMRYRRAFHDRRRRGAALGLPHVAGRHRLEAGSTRPIAPAAATAGPSPNVAPGMKS